MNILDYNHVMAEKLNRRSQIPQLESDVHGHCIHIGPISYACRQCFAPLPGGGIQVGNKCMSDCPACYYKRDRNDANINVEFASTLADRTFDVKSGKIPYCISYQSAGETLKYVDLLEQFAPLYKEAEEKTGANIYHHLYTNGLMATPKTLSKLKDMEIDEIRFHLSASDFSENVIKNMYEAAKMNFIVTVEEPSWPNYKEDFFPLLEVFEDIGVKHLDMVEVQVTENNIDDIEKHYGDHETVGIYKDYYWHLYDGGYVYDVMEEVLKKGYSYSVLDCNSGVERCRHARMHHVVDSPDFYEKGFADYKGFDKQINNKHADPSYLTNVEKEG